MDIIPEKIRVPFSTCFPLNLSTNWFNIYPSNFSSTILIELKEEVSSNTNLDKILEEEVFSETGIDNNLNDEKGTKIRGLNNCCFTLHRQSLIENEQYCYFT